MYVRPITVLPLKPASISFSGAPQKCATPKAWLAGTGVLPPHELEKIPMQKPPGLVLGDTIALVAPASPIMKEEMAIAAKMIREAGFKVVTDMNTKRGDRENHYLSDDDAKRAAAINRAFANPKVKAIFPVTGGGGSYRPDFLRRLDWNLIRKNPKIVIGYSDITYLHAAMQSQGRMVTFHSPYHSEVAQTGEEMYFWEMLMAPKKGAKKKPALPTMITADPTYYRTVVPGKVKGEVVGGNWFTFAATCGTPYKPDWKNKILLLEDWKVDYETLDGQFSQLVNNGLWDNVKGIVFGFCKYINVEYGITWDRFVKDITKEAKKRGIPVGYGFPSGHGPNTTIPMGSQVEFDSTKGIIKMLEHPVASR